MKLKPSMTSEEIDRKFNDVRASRAGLSGASEGFVAALDAAFTSGRKVLFERALNAPCACEANLGWHKPRYDAELILQMGKAADAIAPLERARALGGDHAVLDPLLAKAYLGAKRFAEAHEVITQLAAREDTSLQGMLLKIKYHLALEERPQASALVNEALAQRPEYAELWFTKGTIARQDGKLRTAAEAFLRAIEVDHDYVPAYNGLKFAIVGQPDLVTRAVELLERLRESKGEVRYLISTLSVLYQEQGNLTGSLQVSKAYTRTMAIGKHPELEHAEWPASKGRKLDFMIVGAPKCGTTSLFSYLAQHPKALCPHTKELHFFSAKYNLGMEWYLAHFPSICDTTDFFTGEASPGYFAARHVDDRIRKEIDDPRIIIMLRNPADRTISSYYQRKKMQGIKSDLRTSVERGIAKKLSGELDLEYGENAVSGSTYAPKLRRWLSKFNRERILLVNADRFFASTTEEMERIYRFLGVPAIHGVYTPMNAATPRKGNNEVREMLMEHFQPEIPELNELLGEDTGWDR